jgi:molybdopterin-guanine dinucleotide biosynthesis protein A
MGGADKGLVLHDGQPLAQRVIGRLEPQVGRVLVSANRNLDVYAQWAAVVTDPLPAAFGGPLVGILAALQRIDTEWLLIAPCDLPQLPPNACERLAAAVGAHAAAYACCAGDPRVHSLLCLLHRRCGAPLQALLEAGEARVGAALQALDAIAVAFDAAELTNLNTPDELAAVRGANDGRR